MKKYTLVKNNIKCSYITRDANIYPKKVFLCMYIQQLRDLHLTTGNKK